MTQYISPIVLLALAIGAFVFYINPTYAEVGIITDKIATYDEALNKSNELVSIREALVSRRLAIDEEDLKRLLKMLPDNIDNVRLIVDLDALAAKYGMRISGISIQESSAPSGRGEEIGPNMSAFRSVDIGFSVTNTYPGFKQFLRALETSLRVVDIKTLNFGAASNDERYTFSVMLTTYWLK